MTKLDEMAQEFLQNKFGGLEEIDDFEGELRESVMADHRETFAAGFAAAAAEARWIDVVEDYPKFGELVLVSFCGIVSYGRWDGYFWTVNDEPEHSLLKIDRIKFVTHWQELPKPPAPQEQKS